MSQSKRKWKVYTPDELRERFQPKVPASDSSVSEVASDEHKVPNLGKRRNSAPPGMIHFRPGTLAPKVSPSQVAARHPHHASDPSSADSSPPPSPASDSTPTHEIQHHLVTHTRTSCHAKPIPTAPYARRSSLPQVLRPHLSPSHANHRPPDGRSLPALESYFSFVKDAPPLPDPQTLADPSSKSSFVEAYKNFVTTTPEERLLLPSFQILLKTIREEEGVNEPEFAAADALANHVSRPQPSIQRIDIASLVS